MRTSYAELRRILYWYPCAESQASRRDHVALATRPAGVGGARGDGAATMRDVSFVRGQRGPRWSRSGLQVALLGCSATKPRGEALEVVERCAHELLRSSHRRLVEANASDQQL